MNSRWAGAVARLLIEKGAEVDARLPDGCTALMLAGEFGAPWPGRAATAR